MGTMTRMLNEPAPSRIRLTLRAAAPWAAAAVFACVLGGCSDPLLTPDEPRSQFDRTDMVRGRRAPTYVYDQYGTRKSNIRGRLVNPE